jgi:nucleoside-diphosphate-sugar epimerase
MDWVGRGVLVTGGCSFIGSHLVDALVERKAAVRVVDNLSSGRMENISAHLAQGKVEFIQGELLDPEVIRRAVDGIEVVFHLAADHGGRGYVELHQAACATNLTLDGMVFLACRKAGVQKTVYASSGCVYPHYLQRDPNQLLYLKEEDAGPPYDADNTYGWAKLMGEMTLQAYYRDWGMKSVSLRYFTVYGPRGKEDHAIMAMIARAFVHQNPFVVWGDGNQVRNWTYVSDIVSGTLRAAEEIDNARAINLGTAERVRVIEAAREILRYTGQQPQFEFHPEMPTGPANRVADNSLARRLLGWEPQVGFQEGVHRTIDWYFAVRRRSQVESLLQSKLTER